MLTNTPVIAASVGTAIYIVRVVFADEHKEISHVLSRVILVLLAAVLFLMLDRATLDFIFEKFSSGVIILGGVAAIIAVSGIDILGSVRPARTLGIAFPWFKTTGIPRSYGEQAIILAVALAYLLIYHHRMNRTRKYLLASSCLVIIAVGQSRNIYITAAAVVAIWYLAVRARRFWLVRAGLIACGLATFLVQQAMPLLLNTDFGRGIVGEGIYQRNITVRFSLVSEATTLLDKNPWRALIGWSHLDWQQSVLNEQDATIHNFFFSSLVFLGLVGSGFTIWAFFIRPLSRCVRNYKRSPKESDSTDQYGFLLVAAAGMLVSLNFYEGFFSLTMGLVIGATWSLGAPEQPGSQYGRAVRIPVQRSSNNHTMN